MDRLRCLLFLWMGWLAVANPAGAAEALGDPAPRWYQVKQWTTDNGLPQSTITALRQTEDGYLWIGTRRGLARFNGHAFKVFIDELAIGSGHDANCLELEEDTEGRLWVRTGDGLIAIRHGIVERYSKREGPLEGDIRAMCRSRGGGLWLALNRRLVHFENGMLTAHPLGESARGNAFGTVITLAREDEQGRLWLMANLTEPAPGEPALPTPHWIRYDSSRRVAQTLRDIVGPLPESGEPDEVFVDHTERIWISKPGKLLAWSDGKWSSHSLPAGRIQGAVGPRLQEDSSGDLWGILEGGPVVRMHQGEFTTYGEADGLTDRDIRNVWPDREGNVWVGTGVGGLHQFEPRFFRSLLTTNASGDKNEVYSVAAGDHGKVWFGMDSGLMLRESGRFTLYTNAQPGVNGRFHQNVAPVCVDDSGIPWFGVRPDGLESLRDGRLAAAITFRELGLESWTISSLLKDRKQQLWIASPIGLIAWRGQVLARYSTNNGLSDNDVLGILQAPDNALWIGTGRGGINRFHQGLFQSFRMQGGLLADSAVPLLVEPNGTVWIGTSRGLNRIQGNQIRAVTPREGLFTGQAYSLLDDQRGSLWASGDQGFWRLKKSDLDAVADGRTNWLQCLHYGAGDGVLSSEANGERQPTACRTPDGYLWFPSRRGVVVVDPSKVAGDDVAPSVVLEQIVVADRDVIWGDGMGVGAVRTVSANRSGTSRANPARRDATPPPVWLEAGRGRVIEIHYSANSFTAPERIRFKFILEGHDHNWTLDENNRRMVYYPDLRPGSYKFRVTACNSHQFWSPEEASFAFTIAPHFYETWAFYITCGLAVIAFAAGIQSYRLRLQRRILVLEQQTALERERARIAQDIHDDLGSRLSQLSILGELAERQLGGPNPARGHILKMMDTSKAMFQAMDEIVWAVNPKLDTLAGLASYLRDYAPEVLETAGIHCRLDFPTTAPNYPLSAEARHHLFLVVKEALRNTVQHARATEVRLRLTVAHQTLELTIEDNGVGLRVDPRGPEVAQPAHVGPGSSGSTPDPTGNGLKNMRNRMEEIGGSLVIEASPGKGTTLRLRLPLPDSERL